MPVKGKKKARHQYRVITMLRHFPSDEPSPGFHWATISLFPSREGTPGVSSTVFHQGQRHQANHQQWPDLQEGHLEGKWSLSYLSPINTYAFICALWSIIGFCFICQIYEDIFPPPHQYKGLGKLNVALTFAKLENYLLEDIYVRGLKLHSLDSWSSLLPFSLNLSKLFVTTTPKDHPHHINFHRTQVPLPLTDCCIVDLIDVTLADEDSYSMPVFGLILWQ